MGVTFVSEVFFGVSINESDLVVEEVTVVKATCHPEELKEGVQFCPKCGEPALTEKTVYKNHPRLSKVTAEQEDVSCTNLLQWFGWDKIPGTNLEIFCEGQGEYGEPKDGYYLGVSVRETSSFELLPLDLNSDRVKKARETLGALGFEESEMGYYLLSYTC